MDHEYLKIGDRVIGHGEPCYIIAEIGVNHNGDIDIAKRLIDAAVDAGVDAVKFQRRCLHEVYEERVLADSRVGEQGLQYIVPILQEFELSDDAFRELHKYCHQRGVTFLCTPWDSQSVDFLESLSVPAYKIGSPDMTNYPLIERVVRTGKPLLLSTGMSTEDEIRETLSFLGSIQAAYGLFHCISTYPAAADEINLRFMERLRDWTPWPVGYSGHERGTAVSLAAVALGACMLERHLTLDQTMRGPDHSASLEPAALAAQVKAVREVEAAFGVRHRWMTRGEFLNRRVLAKSLVTASALAAGTVITSEMVVARSPGLGLPPSRLSQLVGRRLGRALQKGEPFLESDLVESPATSSPHPIEIAAPWGIIARFIDVDRMVTRFGGRGMSLIEFHVSDRDLDGGSSGFNSRPFDCELVVHAPEYCHDALIDLCSADPGQRRMSVERLQRTIDLARELAPWFSRTGPGGPKVVIHVGGMSPSGSTYDRDRAIGDLLAGLRALETDGVELLLENLPPFPWFYGGRWVGHVLTDPQTVASVCEQSRKGLCFDSSHAALYCQLTGTAMVDFVATVKPYVRHLHLSDAAGTAGEGLQIGDGEINFVELLPLLLPADGVGLVPEVWLGHQRNGAGFETALERLSEIMWAVRALNHSLKPVPPDVSQRMAVYPSATVVEALRVIDSNTLGTAFVVDDRGVVLGVVTDGDIRRGLMDGRNLRSPVSAVMNREFIRAFDTMSSDEVRSQLSNRYRILPIVDAMGRLVKCVSIYDAPA